MLKLRCIAILPYALLLAEVLTRLALTQRDNNNDYIDLLQAWSLHFQSPVIGQDHARFENT